MKPIKSFYNFFTSLSAKFTATVDGYKGQDAVIKKNGCLYFFYQFTTLCKVKIYKKISIYTRASNNQNKIDKINIKN